MNEQLNSDFWIHAQLQLWKRVAPLDWNQFPQASLFSGAPGRGQVEILKAWFQLQICENKIAENSFERPCENCSYCKRVAHGNHPDLAFHSFEKIGEFRDLLPQVHLHPLEAPRRVVVLQDFQNVTTQSANSLLKTLEEPPPTTLFVLFAHQRGSLLPTIQSRCVEFSVPPLPDHELKYALRLSGWESLDSGVLTLLNGALSSEEKIKLWATGLEKGSEDPELLADFLDLQLAQIHDKILLHDQTESAENLRLLVQAAEEIIKLRLLVDKNLNKKLISFAAGAVPTGGPPRYGAGGSR